MIRIIGLACLMLAALTACAGQNTDPKLEAWLKDTKERLYKSRYWPVDPERPNKYISGVAVVKILVLPDGKVAAPEIVMSSGTPLLDSAALVTVVRSAPFLPPPLAPEDKRGEIYVPIAYYNTAEDQIRGEAQVKRFYREQREAKKKEMETELEKKKEKAAAAQP